MLIVKAGLCPDLNPPQTARWQVDPVFDVKLAVRLECSVERSLPAFVIIGMDGGLQILVSELVAGAASEVGLAKRGDDKPLVRHVQGPGAETAGH